MVQSRFRAASRTELWLWPIRFCRAISSSMDWLKPWQPLNRLMTGAAALVATVTGAGQGD